MDMTRRKIMVSFALDPETIALLEAWIAKQQVKPSKTAVIEAALRQFCEDRQAPTVAVLANPVHMGPSGRGRVKSKQTKR